MLRLLLPSFLIFFGISAVAQPKAQINITVSDAKNQDLILAYYLGGKQYIEDTFQIDYSGKCTISQTEPFEQGIYLLTFPERNMKYVEFLLGPDQQFSMQFELAKAIQTMMITDCEDNKRFFEYNQFVEFIKERTEALNQKKTRYKKNGQTDSLALIESKLSIFDSEFTKYQQQFMKDNPTAFFTKVLGYAIRPTIPDGLDEAGRFYYYKSHYFDNVNWSFDPIIRTPVYEKFLNEYFDNLTVNSPDSIIAACDFFLSKIPAKSELYKSTVITLVNRYASSTFVCFDAIYVHMVEKYYANGKAYWMTSDEQKETLARMTSNAQRLKNSLCGAKAVNFTVRNEFGAPKQLSDLSGKYILLVFWTPNRDEQSEMMKNLASMSATLTEKEVEVIGISTSTMDKTAATNMESYFCLSKTDYDAICKDFDALNRSVPEAVLLNSDKTIRYKHLGASNLEQVISGL